MKQKKKTLLWRIDHPTLPTSSFVFGTMHVRDRAAFAFLQTVRSYLQTCDALATELPLDEHPAPQLMQSMLLPSGQTLDNYLTPARYQKIRRILWKAFGVDVDQYRRFVPMMLINVLSESLLRKDFSHSLDEELWRMAGQMGKQRYGIETLDEQLSLLAGIPLSYQFSLLKSIAHQVNRFRKQIVQSAQLYQTADPQRLYLAVRRGSQGLRYPMLFRRNEIMAERMIDLIRAQPTLCAVGAGHLGGQRGILRLLKSQGFSLSPLPLLQPLSAAEL